MHTPVTLVCGIDRAASRTLAARLLDGDPTRLLVEHDLTAIERGIVGRTEQWGDGALDAHVVDLAHGCVSCTLREDALPTLIARATDGGRAASHIVLLLPEAVEPAGVAEAFHGWVLPEYGATASQDCRISRIVAVVSAEGLVPTLAGGLTLAEEGRAAADADDRTVAEVLVRQIEAADVVVLSDAGPTERALVRMLNPAARVMRAEDVAGDVIPVDVFDLDAVLDRSDPSTAPALAGTRREGDCWSVAWRARAPLHPERLEAALEEITEASLRSRGVVWLAGHADSMVGWDGVGPRVLLGAAGDWLDRDSGPLEDCAWDHVHPLHRARAQLDWDPRFGDRFNELVITGVGPLPDGALAALQAALLDETELARTSAGRLPACAEDPFEDVFAASADADAPSPQTDTSTADTHLTTRPIGASQPTPLVPPTQESS